ncbi:MAG TPA: hypothetical protein VGH89_07060 [Pseudonocardia sp.]|jgi:hypothetical protein
MKAFIRAIARFSVYRSDPVPIPPRSTRRRLIVAISVLMVAAFVLTALVSSSFGLLAVAVGPAYLWFARRATRNMMATDPAPLDERQRAQTLEAHRIAFHIIAGTALVLGLALVNLNLFVLHVSQVDFDRVAWLLFVAGVYLIPWTPIAVLGWRLPDEDPEPGNASDRPPLGGIAPA